MAGNYAGACCLPKVQHGERELESGKLQSMLGTLKLYLDITLARRGPEDLPTSWSLLLVTTVVYMVLFCALVAALGPPPGNWQAQLLVSVVFTLLWIRGLLVLFNKPERFLQTASASFGISLLTLPVAVPLQLQVLKLMEQTLKKCGDRYSRRKKVCKSRWSTTGGSWKRSPTSNICTPPSGAPRRGPLRARNRHMASMRSARTMEISSTTTSRSFS